MAKLGVAPIENGLAQPLYVPGKGARFITVEGDPILPSDVSVELAKIDPALRIDFVPMFGGLNAWCLKRQWRQNDPRWRTVQSGEIAAHQAFDIEHRFPRDCPTGEMVSYVQNRYGERANPDPRAVAQRMIEEAQKMIRDADEAAVDTMVEKGTQRILDENDHLRLLRAEDAGINTHETAHAMVSGIEKGPEYDGPKRLI
jgi:hypothetical protein